MHHLLRWKPLYWLATAALSTSVQAADLPAGWLMQPPEQQARNEDLPSALRAPALTLQQKLLPHVEMVVDLPFNQVLPVVQQALAQLGNFPGQAAAARLSHGSVGTEWSQVLMARQPELKQQMVRQTHLPALEQAVTDGALLATEIPARLARLGHQWTLQSQRDKHLVPALSAEFSHWSAQAEQRHGMLGRMQSTLQVRVMQLDAVLGRPSTAIHLQQTDEWPNPDAGLISQARHLAEFNIMSSGPSARLSQRSVPDALFTPVFNALQALPGSNVQLGASTSTWLPAAATAPATAIVEPAWQAPGKVPALQATQVLAIDRDRFDVSSMQVLADGSVLLVQNYPFALLQWAPADGHTPRTLWKAPSENVHRRLLSADASGQHAYLAADGHLLHFDVARATLSVHPLQFDPPALAKDSYLRFTPDGNGLPLAYRHQHGKPRSTFSEWAPSLPAPASGDAWPYTHRLSAPRQDVVAHGFPGNTQIKPVRWDGPVPQTWVEDAAGLSALDTQTGRLLRTIALPRRFGPVDPHDDTGMAQWVPEPLGSARGGWMAVGFVLMEGTQRNPGMHVVDAANGRVRYSLALPGLDALPAAAASPDGQRLALGGNRQGVVAAVWRLDAGTSQPLQANNGTCWDLRQLQWSPDGRVLWGRCGDALVQWTAAAWVPSASASAKKP